MIYFIHGDFDPILYSKANVMWCLLNFMIRVWFLWPSDRSWSMQGLSDFPSNAWLWRSTLDRWNMLKDLARFGKIWRSVLSCFILISKKTSKTVRSLRKRWWKRRGICLALCPSCRCPICRQFLSIPIGEQEQPWTTAEVFPESWGATWLPPVLIHFLGFFRILIKDWEMWPLFTFFDPELALTGGYPLCRMEKRNHGIWCHWTMASSREWWTNLHMIPLPKRSWGLKALNPKTWCKAWRCRSSFNIVCAVYVQ